MSRLLPFRSPVEREESEPRVLNIEEGAADEVFDALSSATAREILTALYEEPRTASDLAEAVDTTLQNVRYHLENLSEAGLVEVVDTWYSSRGTEMKVYAPADGSVVLFAGEESTGPTIREALGRLVGGVGVLALASLLVQRLFSPPPVESGERPERADDGAATREEAAGATTTTEPTETATVTRSTRTGAETVTGRGTATGTPQTTSEAPVQTQTATQTATEAQTQTQTVTQTATEAQTQTQTVTQTATEAQTQTQTVTQTATETPVQTQTATEVPTLSESVNATSTATPEAAASPGPELAGLEPGVAFFLGGVFALVLAAGWWYWRG